MLSRKKKSLGNVSGGVSDVSSRLSASSAQSSPAVPIQLAQNQGQGQSLPRNSSNPNLVIKQEGRSSINNGRKLSNGGRVPTVGGARTSTSLQPQAPNVEDLLDGVLPTCAQVNSAENEAQRHRDLRKIIQCLGDWDAVNDQTLIKLISGLKNSVDSIDDKMSPLIQQILTGDWIRRSSKVVAQLEDFLSELLVVRPAFCGVAMHSLITKLIPVSRMNLENETDIPLAEQNVFSIAHRNLQRIFESFPMRQESGVKTMGNVYPYMGKGVHAHFAYVKNLLEAMDYLPKVQGQLVHLIIHKLVRVDVNIPKKDIEEALEHHGNRSFTVKTEEGGHEMFSMDLEDEPAVKENPLIQTLDVCLNLMFQYFEKTFKSLPETDEGIGEDDSRDRHDETNRQSLFNSLLSVFESEILPTFGLNNIQFLYFYVLSLQPSFVTAFLEFLWKKASTVNTPAVIRVQAMSFLSGILARAQFISIKTVKRWLTRMADWANAYVNQKLKSCHWSSVNIQSHGPFYAVCQTLFYVFAFRNKELIGSRKCVAFTRTLNLGRLVTSDLNPLKACQEQIAVFFVKAAHQHQISYCRTVLERNQRATVPTITHDNLSNLGSQSDLFSSNQLETFFPFDPLLLKNSRPWIDSIYKTYEAYLEEVKNEPVEPTEENEDSIEMELGSYTGTPGRRTNGFYCNGSLPFKFKTEIKNELEMDSFMD